MMAAAPKKPPQTAKKSTVSKNRSAPSVKKKKHQTSLRSGYYISIYTFTEQVPKKTELDKIMLAGYRYKIHDIATNSKNMEQVMIGPFPTVKKAKKELKRVHRYIVPDAYIVDYSR